MCPVCSAKDLISKLLTTHAEKRLTAAQALEHDWITDSKKCHKSTLTLTRKNLLKHHGGTRFKVHLQPPPATATRLVLQSQPCASSPAPTATPPGLS